MSKTYFDHEKQEMVTTYSPEEKRETELGEVYNHSCLEGTDLVSINVPREMADGVSRIVKELDRAMKKFPDNSVFRNRHEGYGIFLEEADEFWDAIKANTYGYDKGQDCAEAVQVGAMVLHYLKDFGK